MILDEMKEAQVEKHPVRKHPEWEKDYFADTTAGKIALERMRALTVTGTLPKHFRLYEMGWLENGGSVESWDTMEVKGCEFRKAKAGPRRGFYVIPVMGTRRVVHVTKDQMRDYESQQRKLKAIADKKLPPCSSISSTMVPPFITVADLGTLLRVKASTVMNALNAAGLSGATLHQEIAHDDALGVAKHLGIRVTSPATRKAAKKPVKVDPVPIDCMTEAEALAATRVDHAVLEFNSLIALLKNPESGSVADTLTEEEIQAALAYTLADRLLKEETATPLSVMSYMISHLQNRKSK